MGSKSFRWIGCLLGWIGRLYQPSLRGSPSARRFDSGSLSSDSLSDLSNSESSSESSLLVALEPSSVCGLMFSRSLETGCEILALG